MQPWMLADARRPSARVWFLDDVQNAAAWEVFVNRLHRAGQNLVLLTPDGAARKALRETKISIALRSMQPLLHVLERQTGRLDDLSFVKTDQRKYRIGEHVAQVGIADDDQVDVTGSGPFGVPLAPQKTRVRAEEECRADASRAVQRPSDRRSDADRLGGAENRRRDFRTGAAASFGLETPRERHSFKKRRRAFR
ncbi:MAG: hypothetical protein HY716_15650 [Planctomycetes bacterium]|nr:hypothetical protein [Planctomycetota bacterium]